MGINGILADYYQAGYVNSKAAKVEEEKSFVEIATQKMAEADKEIAQEKSSAVLDVIGANAPDEVKHAWMEAEKETGVHITKCGLWISNDGKHAHITQVMIQTAIKWAKGELVDEQADLLGNSVQSAISAVEKDELKDRAMEAAGQVKDVYKDIELEEGVSYGSNIKEFTKEQRREAVALLGNAGFVSVTEDTNMENYEEIEDFYAAYMEKRDVMVTIYEVNRDGLIGAVTFIYRDNRLQTYYVGIGWQEGGIPEIKDTLVSDIAEINLTEKGYFIYAYENPIAHSSLRQYWRIKPLSDKCRELTAKYVYGLSYVNYNVLVTNWDSKNVEDILMPCMFEDIYRIYTGEILRTENWRIPADIYEKIMTTCFPVSIEQLREKCGYDEDSNSYEYEMIFASQYPPFGEVIDYTENPDGTITLVVDGVWADYNSDRAFTNTIVVQPFDDGTFRYLSNSIEQKELEVPKGGR